MGAVKEKYLNNIPYEIPLNEYLEIVLDLDSKLNQILEEDTNELRNRTKTSQGVL